MVAPSLRDPLEPTCLDLEGMPSSLSMDFDFHRQTSQPLQWVDDVKDSDDDPLTSDTSGPGTPSNTTISNPAPLLIPYCGTEPKHAAITCGVRAWTKHQAYGASDALIKYATASPLLPQQVAEMVSNLSVVARVSLKAAAFFIEIILEAVKNSTGITLGITRRALINAVGTARAVHSLASGESWDAKTTGKSTEASGLSFLSILDKYTAVGIYLIHHTFTLTELFAMGTFQLVGSTFNVGLAAADESVRTIDGIFGSNETSRALASFITLVRGEVGNDPRFANDSMVSLFNKLTKAVTAFAVLQNSTYKRSAKSMKMRVVYDCTVLGEVEAKSWRSLMVGSGNFIRNRPAALLASAAEGLETLSLRSPPRRTASLLDSSDRPFPPSISGGNLPASLSRGYLGDGLCLTDIDPQTSARNVWKPSQAPSIADDADDASLIADLNFLVGEDGEDGDASTSSSLTDDQLPKHLRCQLQSFTDEELRDGVVLPETSSAAIPRKHFRRIRKTNRADGNMETVYEITTEVVETIETVTTVERSQLLPRAEDSRSPIAETPCSQTPAPGMLQRQLTSSKSGFETRSIFEDGVETQLEEDEEWCEIRTDSKFRTTAEGFQASSLSPLRAFDLAAEGETVSTLPEAPNGHVSQPSGKSSGYSKMPFVLKTITKKLVHKRKTVRKIEVHNVHAVDIDIVPETNTVLSPSTSHKLHRRSKSPGSPSISPDPSVSPVLSVTDVSMTAEDDLMDTRQKQIKERVSPVIAHGRSPGLGRGISKVLERARNPFKSDHYSDTNVQPTPRSQEPWPAPRSSIQSNSSAVPDSSRRSTSSILTAPLPPAEKFKRVPQVEPEMELKAARRRVGGIASNVTSPRAAMKELPSIPQRGASQHTLFPNDRDRKPFESATPKASVRESKRRSRAPSITSMRSFSSRTQKSSLLATDDIDQGKHGHDPTAFPQAHLVENLRRFMRYSSAAYGQNFMRILGIGSLDYFFPDTSKHHANVWAFAHHVGIPVDCILLNSFSEAQPLFTEQMSPLVNYVAVDDSAQAVVLTCRGTMGLSDILTDLTCDFEPIAVEGGRSDKHYQVHSGMLASTRRLCNENSTVMQTLRLALEDNPNYGLVITGHSLGGGVASLAAVELSCPSDLFRQQVLRRRAHGGKNIHHPKIYTPFVTSLDSGLPPGRPIKAYAYGVPAVASSDLSAHCKGLVTSIIHGHDFVPTLSLGMVRDFKNIAHALSAESESDVAREIMTRVLGTHKKRSALRATLGFKEKVPEHLASLEAPRPQEIPLAEREMHLSQEELMQGKTRNLARDANYTDPNLREDELDPFSYTSGGGHVRTAASSHLPGQQDRDTELADWLWSLIKTIRADMSSDKLYPPGDVYCIESFAVFVTPSVKADSDIVFDRSKDSQARAEAHRVILRYCEDVVKRFSEPVFAKSMLRDHIPTNYELCMSLLYESVIDSRDG